MRMDSSARNQLKHLNQGQRSTRDGSFFTSSFDGSAVKQLDIEPLEQETVVTETHSIPKNGINLSRLVFSLLVISSLLLAFLSLYFMWQKQSVHAELLQIQSEQEDQLKEMDILLNNIAQNFDYQKIKEIAEENGMQQSPDRVREID